LTYTLAGDKKLALPVRVRTGYTGVYPLVQLNNQRGIGGEYAWQKLSFKRENLWKMRSGVLNARFSRKTLLRRSKSTAIT
jgi:hypothetical protein